MHECDEYHGSLDQRMGLATIWKEPSDVDHWRVELDILAAIDMLNSLRIDTDQWRGEIADSVWDGLLDKRYALSAQISGMCPTDTHRFRLKVTRESITAAGNLLPLRTRFNAKIAMTEYLPNIRSLCQYDQGIAGRGRALRSRQKRRYLPLSDEKRQKLVGDGLEENKVGFHIFSKLIVVIFIKDSCRRRVGTSKQRYGMIVARVPQKRDGKEMQSE